MSRSGLLGVWRRLRGSAATEPAVVDAPGRPDLPEAGGITRHSPSISEHIVSEVGAIESAIASGDLAGARTRLDAASAARSGDATLLLQLARVERLSGQPQAALEACELALALADSPSEVQTERAHALAALPDLEGAIDALHVALELDECNGEAWLLLGQILQRLDSRADAIAAFERAAAHLSQPSEVARAWRLVGAIKVEATDSIGARQAFEASLALEPDNANAYLGLGIAALWVDEEPTALSHFEAAVARTSTPSNTLLMNLAYALQHTGRIAEAHAVYSRLASQDPRDSAVRWYLCLLDLTLCNWRAGWDNYHSRFTSGAASYRPIAYRPWDGRDIGGQTLLVLADEGIGDEILYASCLADAQARAGRIIIECEPRLHGLFARSFPGVMTLASRRENSAGWLEGYPRPDWQIPSGGLPGIFRRSDEDFPKHAGYLQAEARRVDYWREHLAHKLGPGLKIGISWRGGTTKTRQRARSIALPEWAPILAMPGVHFVNLQYGDYQSDLTALNELHGDRILNLPDALADYDDTAALVEALDLVITVCTAIVHLAGALGRPVWVLTPLVPGWRYTANRDVMPWYPSSRLFRQRTWGEWAPVCQEVTAALADLTKDVTRT